MLPATQVFKHCFKRPPGALALAVHTRELGPYREDQRGPWARTMRKFVRRSLFLRLSDDFTEMCRPEGQAQNIQSDEKQGPKTKIALPSKAVL